LIASASVGGRRYLGTNDMSKFRKKPVVIEAFQWTGQRPANWPEWATKVRLLDGRDLIVDTLEGRMRADLGDWIIKGVKGEQYPCKPDIFLATYEPVAD
jgi:hypothetical protein